ncbi:GGDEF domain-containing protein [Alkalimarinus alittae]|uniref:diguanylate cyclase n=1 Tax=Alkalimarinus alittae TaxID=2961619 RepID=A0ABY6N2Y1_9ALTE|nr:GGDEF domain-containing protein [Alkalimarinus alittae]UZE96463.1 GGDEF domain-containing protein [Alkalimarinus alittae]
MSGSGTASSDLKRWKEKCFAQAEELEQQEKSFEDHTDLLQRLLVRVSLAADGLNEALDTELASLRDQLRKGTASKTELSSRLSKIEKAVLALDEQKSERTSKVLEALQSLVDQLLELALERKQRKQLKQLSKDIRGKKNGLREYPNLLMQYAHLQEDALKHQFSMIGQENKNGILQRIFGTNNSNGEAIQTDSATLTTADSEDKQTLLDEDATELDLAENGDDVELTPGFSAVSKHVSIALSNLITQLSIPENVESTAEKIQTTIQNGLNWYELGPTIDDVANLVISSVGKGQKDFELFLQNLDDRLATLQSFLAASKSQQLDWQGSTSDLDRTVRDQVKTISQEVLDANDIDHLKVSVTSHIETIIASMDNFVASEDTRIDEMNKQMEAMQHRLQTMETEAGEIRSRLQVERAKALTDILTGLANREAYEERLQMEFERWQRYRQPAAIVVADIDFFKRVNDDYGHLAGDKVIQIIAKELSNRIRKTDFVARYGGEEFVIIMPETTLEDAIPVMEKTREMISRLPFHFRDENVQITMSFGIAAFQDKDSPAEIFELADKALYKAKENGRNRVEISDNSSEI